MIVISGALVLVALVLLIFGITTTDLDFVYASIVVSLVSFVFLLIGILQRRGDKGADAAPATSAAAADEPTPEPARDELEEGVAVTPRVRERAPTGSARIDEPASEEPVLDEAPADDELFDEEPIAGTVLVVPGRPRYHVAGCRYLTGKSASEVEVGDARDEGFSPCGVCKPDDVLAAADEDAPVEDALEEPVGEAEPETDEIVLEDVPGASEVEEPVEEPVAAVAPARRSRTTTAPRKAPAKRSPRPRKTSAGSAAVLAAAEPTADAPAQPGGDPVLEAVAGEAPATAAAADGAGAAPARRRTGSVVVIPDRGKFHRSECRYVRNAEGTSTMSRTQAARQGYDACGVCKP